MSLPSVTATGRLTASPELRRTGTGAPVCRMRLACTERRRTTAGRWVDGPTTFLDVDVLGRSAGSLTACLGVGDLVVATGLLVQRDRADGSHAFVLKADAVGRVEVPVSAA
ncbi:MAG: single-stranded DNA-binding protein [Propionicimonas sp.]